MTLSLFLLAVFLVAGLFFSSFAGLPLLVALISTALLLALNSIIQNQHHCNRISQHDPSQSRS